ncbi:MAG TPA: hypothetical protein G4O10_05110 [Dehalococcoidia bacterium]|nr:hypothetical protein [Dehalococcoidia bacterium]
MYSYDAAGNRTAVSLPPAEEKLVVVEEKPVEIVPPPPPQSPPHLYSGLFALAARLRLS